MFLLQREITKDFFEIIEDKAGVKKILENHNSSKASQTFCDEFVNGMILYIANPKSCAET